MNLPDTFTAKTRTRTDCILWVGATNSRGYGCFGTELAHRVAWEHAHGPIPEAMTIDHLCRVKQCVNPDHLEVVSRAENVRRARRLVVGEACSNGHPIANETDLYANPRGRLECRECRRESYRRAKATA